jgi:hypothetical protein
MAHIAILEGYEMARKTHKKKTGWARKFAKTAKLCSRVSKHGKGSFRACMKKHLKKGE